MSIMHRQKALNQVTVKSSSDAVHLFEKLVVIEDQYRSIAIGVNERELDATVLDTVTDEYQSKITAK
jgi:hypothetical protein